MHCIPLSWTSSPCNFLFLNLGLYGLVQATVGVGTVLIWDLCVAYTRGGGYKWLPMLQPLLCKQPFWAVGDTPHLMPVKQGLPWHLVAVGPAGQAIPCVATASHTLYLSASSSCFPAFHATCVKPNSALLPALASLPIAFPLVPPGVAPGSCLAVLLSFCVSTPHGICGNGYRKPQDWGS